MQNEIPKPTVSRLCLLYRFLIESELAGIVNISSAQIGEQLNINSHNVRKDISYLGYLGHFGGAYNIEKLKQAIAQKFDFNREKNVCVVGLGRLGMAILEYEKFFQNGYKIVAGFDSNINKLETMRTHIEVFPSHTIPETVRRKNIELAVLTVPQNAAQNSADILVNAGVSGIINFTSVILKTHDPDVFISNISVLGEFYELSAQITLNNSQCKE